MTKFYVTFLDGVQAIFEGSEWSFKDTVLQIDDMVVGSVRLFKVEKVVEEPVEKVE